MLTFLLLAGIFFSDNKKNPLVHRFKPKEKAKALIVFYLVSLFMD